MMPRDFVPRAGYAALRAYSDTLPRAPIDLAANTNQWGTAPSALEALRESGVADLRDYPTSDSDALLDSIAEYIGVPRECVIVGCGSDGVLDAALRALVAPSGRVAHADPTFVMGPHFAAANGLMPIGVPFRADGDLDADAMLAANARVNYVCAPNNPTGTSPSRSAIMNLVNGASGVTIVDEAYAEFSGESYARDAATDGRLLATRTMSKVFGLAGLRIGYGIGVPALIAEIRKARGPYTVSTLSERAAVAALTNDRPWIDRVVTEVREVRTKFTAVLTELGYTPLASDANFVCVPVENAPAIASALRMRGIGVRAFTRLTGIGDALRITLAPWDVLEKVVGALSEISREEGT